jgi:hypothetical protein
LKLEAKLQNKFGWLAFCLFISNLAFLAIPYSWEPEQHHDGIIFPAAIAIRDGLVPNRDVFTQYGPLAPWLQGLWLQLTSPTLLNLRIFSVLQVVVISQLLFWILRKRLKSTTAFLISLAWSITGPFGLPWPSLLITISLLLTILLLDLDVENWPLKRTGLGFRYFLAGFILVVGSLARIQNLLGVVLIACVLLYFGIKRKKLVPIYFFLFGSISATVLSLMLMIRLHMLGPYIEQCIVWGLKLSGKLASPISISLIADRMWFPIIAIIILVIVFFSSRFLTLRRPSWLWDCLICLISFGIFSSTIALSRIKVHGAQTLRNPEVLLSIGTNKFLYLVGYFATSVTAFLLLRKLFVSVFKRSHGEIWDETRFIVAAVALVSLSTLYPIPDNYHLWFVTPVFLVFISLFSSKFKNFDLHPKAVNLLLIGLIAGLVFQIYIQTTDSRYTHSARILQGMSSSYYSAPYLDRTLKLLQDIPVAEKIHFDCADGIYAAANGHYMADSSSFVNWSPSSQNGKSSSFLFACYLDQAKILEYTSKGWSVQFSTPWKWELDGVIYPSNNVLFSRAP